MAELLNLDQARFLEVSAGVRYWEDAALNDVADVAGQVPLRQGDRWTPVIELQTGRVLGWPAGVAARIHYKVCDDGEYWLQDAAGQRMARWRDYYVPDDLLCVGTRGHGDYIIFQVTADGFIFGWRAPCDLHPGEWAAL